MSTVPLQLDGGRRAELTATVVAAVEQFVDGLGESRATYPGPDPALIRKLGRPPPEHGGSDVGDLMETITSAARTGFDTAGGSQLSYIPNGGLYSAALGRFMAAALNRFVGVGSVQPGVAALEQSVIDWMLDLFDLGPAAAGILVSGASTAALEAMITARHRMGDRFDDAVVYCSERAHHSVAKAARLAGIPGHGVRGVRTDPEHRIDVDELRRVIGSDIGAGLRPMMIVATAGTTDTGAVDPLVECAELAAEHNVWLHVDAAYGGFFALTSRGRRLLDGIQWADSIAVDAHKGLQIPYGVGALLVADGRRLIAAHGGDGPYLPSERRQAGVPDFSAMGTELTRPFRGLDLWLPLQLHGVARFRAELDRMLDLAARTARRLRAIPGVTLLAEPTLSIVAFTCGETPCTTRDVLAHVNDSGEVHVSGTTIDGRPVIRMAFLNFRTTSEVADRAVELVAGGIDVVERSNRTAA